MLLEKNASNAIHEWKKGDDNDNSHRQTSSIYEADKPFYFLQSFAMVCMQVPYQKLILYCCL